MARREPQTHQGGQAVASRLDRLDHYTWQAGDSAPVGISVAGVMTVNGAIITDVAGNQAEIIPVGGIYTTGVLVNPI
jgi:hypothetical protein